MPSSPRITAWGHRALFGYGYFGIRMENQTVNVADLPRVNERWIKPSEGLLPSASARAGRRATTMDMVPHGMGGGAQAGAARLDPCRHRASRK